MHKEFKGMKDLEKIQDGLARFSKIELNKISNCKSMFVPF